MIILLFSFFVDYAAFPYRGRVYRTEIYYQIPYHELIYRNVGDELVSRYQVIFEIKGSDLLLADTLTKKAVIRSFRQAKERDLSFVDQHNYILLPGEYQYQVTIICSTKVEARGGKIHLAPIDREHLTISDLELAIKAEADTAQTPFTKFGLVVVPNPSSRFGGRWRVIFPYFELYNLKPDGSYYRATFEILDSTNRSIKILHKKAEKLFSAQNEVIGIDLAGLKAGSYTLKVTVYDSTKGEKVSRSRPFQIVGGKGIRVSGRYDELIKVLLGTREYERYRKMDLVKRKAYIDKFKRSDLFQNYQRRVSYANEHFQAGTKAGWKTDRGRIYIKYGPPDETVSKTFEEKLKPIQHWVYYASGLHFIFMDLYGDGDYRLVWSNSKDDPGFPDWDRYLPEWVIEEY